MLSTATREGMKEQVVDNLPKRIKQVKFGIMCVDLPSLWPFCFRERRRRTTGTIEAGNKTTERINKLISAKVPE